MTKKHHWSAPSSTRWSSKTLCIAKLQHREGAFCDATDIFTSTVLGPPSMKCLKVSTRYLGDNSQCDANVWKFTLITSIEAYNNPASKSSYSIVNICSSILFICPNGDGRLACKSWPVERWSYTSIQETEKDLRSLLWCTTEKPVSTWLIADSL